MEKLRSILDRTGYVIKEDKVYYNWEKILDADYKTFKELNVIYANDENHVYYEGVIIEWRDLEIFLASCNGYIKIKGNVYFCWKQIEDVEYDSFEIIDAKNEERMYAKDKNNVYRRWIRLEWVDPATFEPLLNNYSRDNKFVYWYGKRLEKVDVNTFELLGYYYSKDKNYVYYGDKVI